MDELSLYYGAHTGGEIDSAVSTVLDWDSGGIPDIANISIVGDTNDTGSTISTGTYFYLSGALVVAKTDIANGATLTSGTNYDAVTGGGMNALLERIRPFVLIGKWASGTATISLPKGFGARVMIFSSAISAYNSLLIVQSTSGGQVATSVIFNGSGINFSTGNGTLIATLSSSGSDCNVSEMPLTSYRYSTFSTS